jgi:hypothetical protein
MTTDGRRGSLLKGANMAVTLYSVAKNLNKALPVIGSILGIGFELWDSFSQRRKEEECNRPDFEF